ncbi:glycosyltransferase family 39 protein [Candidatus Microgenomates bacterium]|nr:glycosyltransferase family 39 protein [Candidatus Microgenomates bacterium]
MKIKKQNIHIFILLIILVIGGLFRFYNTPLRYSLGGDSGRDVLTAKEAAKQFQLPLTGSFSSLGPFTFGPWYYYILIFSYFLIPSIWAPYIIVGLISILMIVFMYKIGELLENKWFGLILAVLTAFSPFQISSATAVLQPSLVGPLTALALYFFLEIWLKKHSSSFGVLLGISIGLAINMHYQAVSFLILPMFFLFKKEKRNHLITTILGVFLTALPLVFFELNNHWFNTQNIIRFFLYDQYRLWVSNRWLTYAFKFWPQFWSEVTGLPFILSFISIALFAIVFAIKTIQKKSSTPLLLVAIHFIVLLVMIRYWRGEKFFGYLQFFHPYMFLFLGYIFWWIFNLRIQYANLLGIIVLLITLGFSTLKSKQHLKPNFTTSETIKKYSDLKENYPNQKFSLYHCSHFSQALPLILYLDMQKDYKETGKRIGIESGNCSVIEKKEPLKKPIAKKFPSAGLKMLDLEEATPAALLKAGWQVISPKSVHSEILRWWFKLQP